MKKTECNVKVKKFVFLILFKKKEELCKLDEIDEKLKEEAGGSTDKKELFKLRGQVAKTMWDGEFSFIL